MENKLPVTVEQEKSIISCMLQDEDGALAGKAVELGLKEEDFSVPAHGRVFRYILKTISSGERVELISATDEFETIGLLEHIGGPIGLTKLYGFSTTNAFFDAHLKAVIDSSNLRKTISACKRISDEAYAYPENVSEFIDQSEAEIFSIRRDSAKDVPSSKNLVKNVIEEFTSYVGGKKDLIGLETRYQLLNTLTGGFKPGELIVIAARPSVGKSAIACNLSEDFISANKSGLFFTLEMTDQQVMKRVIYGKAEFPMILLKPGFQPTKGEIINIERASREVAEANFWVDDTPAISLMEIRAKARRRQKESGLDYIIIDYLQLMKGDVSQGREREIAGISGGLKGLAKELEIPIIVLAQLNRNAETRANGEPRMSDLRESGAIEQDADLIGLLHRSDYQNNDPDKPESEAKLILAKNRNGPTSPVSMKFVKNIMSFK